VCRNFVKPLDIPLDLHRREGPAVRSAGTFVKEAAAGPLPLPSAPWQTAQYELNIFWPSEADTGLMGTFSIFACAAAVPTESARAMMPTQTCLIIWRLPLSLL
jgi:hypothetical protein